MNDRIDFPPMTSRESHVLAALDAIPKNNDLYKEISAYYVAYLKEFASRSSRLAFQPVSNGYWLIKWDNVIRGKLRRYEFVRDGTTYIARLDGCKTKFSHKQMHIINSRLTMHFEE